jgi:large conductance mechanosensitive channel
MSFWNEFKAFATRGNVMELAVAVVIGTAFSKIVSSLVDGIIMPILGLLLSGVNITNKTAALGHVVIKWGLFLQAVIDFTIIAFSIFVMIKVLNAITKRKDIMVSNYTLQERLLMEIRDHLIKEKAAQQDLQQ